MSRERKLAIRYADTWFSHYICMRDGECYTCGEQANLECGHLFSRTFLATRWNEEAAKAQCRRCNCHHEADPLPFEDKFIREYGYHTFVRIKRLTKRPVLLATHEIRAIGRLYRDKYRNLLGERDEQEQPHNPI